jgi:hypothetical protein
MGSSDLPRMRSVGTKEEARRGYNRVLCAHVRCGFNNVRVDRAALRF